MKKALLFGASGFIGSHLLQELLKSPEYDRVTAVVRRPLSAAHPKLKTVIGDFQSLPGLKAELVADELFIALGTTRTHTPDQKKYYEIDHDYPVLAAKLAKENGATSVFIVTAIGADAKSPLFYVRTKGEIERDIKALGFEHTHIFQPSMITGQREEERSMEKVFIKAWKAIDPIFVGGLSRYRGIDGAEVAKAMVAAARDQHEPVKVYQWRDMRAALAR